MEIRLSAPNTEFEQHISQAAKAEGCWALVKWAKSAQIRFTLLALNSPRQAPTEVQDKVIRALLVLDPEAEIRTARATFESLADWDAQFAARVP
jgi:hypothetical protein